MTTRDIRLARDLLAELEEQLLKTIEEMTRLAELVALMKREFTP